MSFGCKSRFNSILFLSLSLNFSCKASPATKFRNEEIKKLKQKVKILETQNQNLKKPLEIVYGELYKK